MLQRDAATFLLNGTLTFCEPVFGRVCACVFKGKGQLQMTPPTQVEREQLQRNCGGQSLEQEFESMVLVFYDSTFQQLTEGTTFKTCSDSVALRDVLRKSSKYLQQKSGTLTLPTLAPRAFDGFSDHYFNALVFTGANREYLYQIDPLDQEPVKLYRSYIGHEVGDLELISEFFEAEEYVKGPDYSKRNSMFDIVSYRIESTISDRLHFSSTCIIGCSPRYSARNWVHFLLASNLDISSVKDEAGATLDCFTDGSFVYVRLKTPLSAGKVFQLKLEYEGDIFLRQVDIVFTKFGSSAWYPRTGEIGRSSFDMTFHTSTDLTFVSAGKLVSSEQNGNMLTTHYVIDKPAIHSSFAIGVYKKLSFEGEGLPPVDVYYERSAKYAKEVANDLRTAMKYYQEIYGPTNAEKMTAAEIYASHGQAFPDFVHLSYYTFRSGESGGEDESFVAHEAAHQWWGGAVAWSNYHDQWMSEAFATYSSMMYMQAVLKDNTRFFELLDKSKKRLLNLRSNVLSGAVEAAPMWLGRRTASTDQARKDYNLIIYSKGAWVLHMLRNMMMDFDTFSDSSYLAMMKDFFVSNREKEPTTADFQKMVEKHIGRDMSWFFNQWVYGNKIPTYTVAYKSEKQPDGQIKVRVRLKQQNVPPDFSVVMPLLLDFGEKGSSVIRTVVTGEVSEFDLPLLPFEPKNVEFNPYRSILCGLETEKW